MIGKLYVLSLFYMMYVASILSIPHLRIIFRCCVQQCPTFTIGSATFGVHIDAYCSSGCYVSTFTEHPRWRNHARNVAGRGSARTVDNTFADFDPSQLLFSVITVCITVQKTQLMALSNIALIAFITCSTHTPYTSLCCCILYIVYAHVVRDTTIFITSRLQVACGV